MVFRVWVPAVLGLVLIVTAACDGDDNGGPDVTIDMIGDDVRQDDTGEDRVEEEEGMDAVEVEEDMPSDGAEDVLDAADIIEIEVEENEASEMCEGMADAFCDYIKACCTMDERDDIASLIVCDDLRGSAFFLDCYARIGPYVSDGTAEINVAAVPGCLAIFWDMSLTCPDFNSAPMHWPWYMETGCSRVVRGFLSPSEECDATPQCTGDYYCDVSLSPSVCRAKVERGGACSANEACMPGDVCIFEVCLQPSEPGGNCDDGGDCGVGLYCDEEGGSVCRELLSEGEECDGADDLCEGRCLDGDAPGCSHFCDGM